MACTEHPVSADGVFRTWVQPLVSALGHPSGTLITAFTGTLPPLGCMCGGGDAIFLGPFRQSRGHTHLSRSSGFYVSCQVVSSHTLVSHVESNFAARDWKPTASRTYIAYQFRSRRLQLVLPIFRSSRVGLVKEIKFDCLESLLLMSLHMSFHLWCRP